ncbi:transglutaminase-like domain-containing protein [Streptomyces aureoverticillatus]|uniref:transglutaminase-like domain-containing protein n=1 Tax=Streptomyces aureoverticillatus TaxID=66871 RepID=UPI0013DCAE0C|nr:transglutaminase-like domain-containing protein [Streptomyces aureoverticillatus]QIB42895.1 transglutaminase domain-containing protein [Streptomyces aureoverticillatus]
MDSDYLTQSPYTAPGPRLAPLVGSTPLPRDPAALAALVRGVLLHREEGGRFGYAVPEERMREDAESRYAEDVLRILGERGDTPLTEAREPAARFVATCRDFALLLCSLLRATGTPARLRCGYGTYFQQGLNDNHWVTEFWTADRGWVLADAQLIGGLYDISFDPMDVPRTEFLVAGDAWRACREGRADPDTFGVSTVPTIKGWALVRADVVADLAALGGVEALPWDGWGLMEKDGADVTEEELALLDAVAAVGSAAGLAADVQRPDAVRRLLDDPRLAVPAEIVSHTTYGGERAVSLPVPARG